MRIILDQDIHFNPVPAELGLDADTAVDLLASDMKLGGEDCVILISAMANGFMAAHQKLFMENPDVSRWIVVLVKENYVITASKIMGVLNALHVQGDVIPCPAYDAEALRKELSRRLVLETINKKSCLIFSRRENSITAALAALIGDMLPGWSIETQTGRNPPIDSAHGSIIVASKEIEDFINLPAEIASRALLVLVQAPGNVQVSRSRDALIGYILETSGLNWSREIIRRRSFIIHPQYESLRRLIQEKPAALNSLPNERSFTMWDQFGLPVNRSLYTPEAIGEFLKSFNECESLIDRLKNQGG